MTDTIESGTILIAEGTSMPDSVRLESRSCPDGWATVRTTRASFEKAIEEAGWTFFFVAGGIKETALGFDRSKTLRSALRRIIATAKSRNCNSVEITRVTNTSFLAVPCVSISARLRHVQQGAVLHQPVALPEDAISLSAAAFRQE